MSRPVLKIFPEILACEQAHLSEFGENFGGAWSRRPVSARRLSLKSPEGVDNRMLNESVYNEF